MTIIDIVKLVDVLCSAGLAIVAFATVLYKPVRNRLVQYIKEITHTQENTNMNKELLGAIHELENTVDQRFDSVEGNIEHITFATKVSLRNSIKSFYNEHANKQTLSVEEKEDLTQIHNAYNGVNGNNFGDTLYNEMMQWKTSDD